MMLAAFKDVEWTDMDVAVPAFFASIFMCLAYSISTGIAAGFIFYIIVKIAKGRFKDVHPIVTGATVLFIINFLLAALF